MFRLPSLFSFATSPLHPSSRAPKVGLARRAGRDSERLSPRGLTPASRDSSQQPSSAPGHPGSFPIASPTAPSASRCARLLLGALTIFTPIAAHAAGADVRPTSPAPTNSAPKTSAPAPKASAPEASSTAKSAAPVPAAPPAARPPAPARGDYILQPSDRLQIQVFQEDDLKQEVRISQEYLINLPLIGQVNLKGRTVREAQILIRDLYDKDYLVNPQVTLTLLEYAKTYVNVIGSVGSAGPIVFPPEQGMTLMDAISKAGGFTRLADKKKVALTRTVDGKTDRTIINTEDILTGKAKDIPLIKDDVINVPESLL
jgi:polysaccharide export outer membrane protein